MLSEDKDGKPGEQEDIMDEEEEQDEEEDNSIWSNLNMVKRVKKMKRWVFLFKVIHQSLLSVLRR